MDKNNENITNQDYTSNNRFFISNFILIELIDLPPKNKLETLKVFNLYNKKGEIIGKKIVDNNLNLTEEKIIESLLRGYRLGRSKIIKVDFFTLQTIDENRASKIVEKDMKTWMANNITEEDVNRRRQLSYEDANIASPQEEQFTIKEEYKKMKGGNIFYRNYATQQNSSNQPNRNELVMLDKELPDFREFTFDNPIDSLKSAILANGGTIETPFFVYTIT